MNDEPLIGSSTYLLRDNRGMLIHYEFRSPAHTATVIEAHQRYLDRDLRRGKSEFINNQVLFNNPELFQEITNCIKVIATPEVVDQMFFIRVKVDKDFTNLVNQPSSSPPSWPSEQEIAEFVPNREENNG